MTKADFDRAMTTVIMNYNGKIEKVHAELIWHEFHTASREMFEKTCYRVMRDNQFPPRLFEFVQAFKNVKEEEILASKNRVLPPSLPEPGDDFLPTDEMIDAWGADLAAKDAKYNSGVAATLMRGLRRTAISARKNYENLVANKKTPG